MITEGLGPATIIIESLLAYTDHLYHNRPGIVVADPRNKIGVQWSPVTHKDENGDKVVYRLTKVGRKTHKTKLGVLADDGKVRNGAVVGEYRPAGLFPEVAVWFYSQVAEVWKLDNEFAARWASQAFRQNHRDLKVVLAAFLLVQSRKGDPVMDAGEVLFHDDDYRDVGEAMMLIQDKGNDLNPKLLLRIWDVLMHPEIAAINHALGFDKSARHPTLGRWPKVVEKWLRYREQNSKMLAGLVKAGFTTTVRKLAQRVHYKPTSERFFEILRWKQKQSSEGHRSMAIGKAVKAAESWDGLTEAQICEYIEKTRLSWKRIAGLLPREVGVTRAVMTAAIEAGSLSNKDLVIFTPTLEELGLLKVPAVKERWTEAVKAADDMRAANIARNVRSKEIKEKLEEGADKAVQKVIEEVTRGLRVYVMVDVSGSMQGALQAAKPLVAKLVQPFPLDRVHVCTFNTAGRIVTIKHPSTKGVEGAFKGIRAGGGTDYGSGIRILQQFKPQADEDAILIIVGDEQANTFMKTVRDSGLNPLAIGLMRIVGGFGMGRTAVQDTAVSLRIPCFMIDERTFADDPYAIPRTMRALVAATPVGEAPRGRRIVRVTLVDQILQTELLKKPTWA